MSNYKVIHIPLDKILIDSDFNCRGYIAPIDVADLVKDIELNDLQFPIAVQSSEDVDLPDRYDYRVMAGHRRFVAFQVLGRKTIPAMVKPAMTELQARLLNLNENLQRKDLDILQEAKAISKLKDLNMSQDAIARELGMSRGWVQCRFSLLTLPEDIQAEAAAGMINQYQIRQIQSLGSRAAQYDAVKRIKNAMINGKRGIGVGKSAKQDPFKKKRQPKNAVAEMIAHLGESIGYGLHTRTLAWANGEINSAELYFDVKLFANEKGVEYVVPFGVVE